MDYEKKYKEALEKARQLCAYPTTKPFISDLQDLFPELAESEQKPNGGIVREDFTQGDGWYKVNLDYLSKAQVEEIEQLVEKWNPKEVSEDEKIKKAILIYLDWLDGKKDYLPKGDYTIKDMILWLEKQGQVKESFISQHENKMCKENDDSLTSENDRIRREIINYFQCQSEEEPTRKEIHNKWIAWIERQGEKDAITFNNAHIIDPVLNDYCCKQYDALHKENGGVLSFARLQHLAMDIYGWCKEYLQCEQKFEMKTAEESLGIDSDTYNKIVDECIFGEPKPEENKGNVGGISPNWSEEDEIVFDSVIGDILNADTFIGGKETASYKCDWLKSLKDRVQSKQELSEEDEAFLDDVLCKLEHDLVLNKDEKDWLKSLRPQSRWKPSSEQIGLLQAIINEPNNAASESCQIVLREVLEQLKKLKEE